MESKKLSESIINLTLRESQNLITKSSDLVTSVGDKLKADLAVSGRETIDKSASRQGNEALSIKPEKDVSELKRTTSKKKTLKNISNLTLNNCCNGSIVLKNISNLTINTCKQPQMKSKPEDSAPLKPCATSKSCDGSFYQCDFYQRLISENEVLKRSIVNQSLCTTYADPIATTCMSPPPNNKAEDQCDDGTYSINSTADDTTTSSIMDEAEAVPRIDKVMGSTIGFDPTIEEITTKTMMADNLMNNPPMIQCWLNKMLLETETEAQNITEFLEISNIM